MCQDVILSRKDTVRKKNNLNIKFPYYSNENKEYRMKEVNVA